LRQAASRQRVHAAADAQHQAAGAGALQLVAQEGHATLDLLSGVERVGQAELGTDTLLQGALIISHGAGSRSKVNKALIVKDWPAHAVQEPVSRSVNW